ncbi:hypothetical protein P9112_004385 [Eukaryota sp. TZLM1-RC]
MEQLNNAIILKIPNGPSAVRRTLSKHLACCCLSTSLDKSFTQYAKSSGKISDYHRCYKQAVLDRHLRLFLINSIQIKNYCASFGCPHLITECYSHFQRIANHLSSSNPFLILLSIIAILLNPKSRNPPLSLLKEYPAFDYTGSVKDFKALFVKVKSFIKEAPVTSKVPDVTNQVRKRRAGGQDEKVPEKKVSNEEISTKLPNWLSPFPTIDDLSERENLIKCFNQNQLKDLIDELFPPIL